MAKITNIPLSKIRKFLTSHGFTKSHDTGGHEVWVKEGMPRPIVLQSHIDPVPVHIVNQIRRHCNLSTPAFCQVIDSL